MNATYIYKVNYIFIHILIYTIYVQNDSIVQMQNAQNKHGQNQRIERKKNQSAPAIRCLVFVCIDTPAKLIPVSIIFWVGCEIARK